MTRQKGFGGFGSGKPTIRKKSRLSIVLYYGSILAALVFFAPPLWKKSVILYRTVVEGESPVVEFGQLPAGLGSGPVTIEIKVSDTHSGLEQVIVQLEQSRSIKEITRKNYSRSQQKDTFNLEIDASQLGVTEGQVTLGVKVFDRSLWSNSTKKTAQFVVDYEPPRIELLSTQHNVYEGGVELVFYRLPSDPNAFSGVFVNSKIFPGFPAITLDESFAQLPDVYFAFFAVPANSASEKPTVTLFARDEVGNTTHGNVPFRVLTYSGKSASISLERNDFSQLIDRCYQQYFEFSAKFLGKPLGEFYPTISDEELKERFQALINDYQPAVEQEARQFFSRPKREKFWKGHFGRPVGAVYPVGFLGNLEWKMQGQTVGNTIQQELWFQAKQGREVLATNGGKVIFADNFGIYGTTVVLDHGFGLTTLHTHLSSVGCAEGDELRKGDLVGLTGHTGLMANSGSGFQLRLHGEPIRPAEWWDRKWLTEHIDRKINTVLKNLGVSQRRPIDSRDF